MRYIASSFSDPHFRSFHPPNPRVSLKDLLHICFSYNAASNKISFDFRDTNRDEFYAE